MPFTPLPYIFDLLYDFKSVEMLHAHLTGEARQATSATDQALLTLMRDHQVALPAGMSYPPVEGEPTREELLSLLLDIHEHSKRPPGDDSSTMDSAWVRIQTGALLARQPGLSAEQVEAFRNPSAFLPEQALARLSS